jgi:hypothetical protein
MGRARRQPGSVWVGCWVLALGWLSATAQAAAPGGAGALRQALSRFNQDATEPLPALTDGQLQQLLAGDVVRFLDPPDADSGARRAVGLMLSDRDPAELWVAFQDPHYVAVDDLTERRLRLDSSTGRAVWYGHIDLPAPFKDRHWMVDVWNNHALYANSGGLAWEHAWREKRDSLGEARPLAESGALGAVDAQVFGESLETPLNRGAWVLLSLPDRRTLFAYHATSVVGGNIPEGLFSRYVLMGMDKLLRGIDQRARGLVADHYRAGHAPLPGPGPFSLPFFP